MGLDWRIGSLRFLRLSRSGLPDSRYDPVHRGNPAQSLASPDTGHANTTLTSSNHDHQSNLALPQEQYREPNVVSEPVPPNSSADSQSLVSLGIEAALSAGKKAFWLDFECVRDADGVARSSSNSMDVYHICDIVRAAHSMIIALGPPAIDKVACALSTTQVGSRTVLTARPGGFDSGIASLDAPRGPPVSKRGQGEDLCVGGP